MIPHQVKVECLCFFPKVDFVPGRDTLNVGLDGTAGPV